MATINHGILGGFSGKVGNIVGYRYKKRFCIRQMPVKSLKPPTLKQLAQRSKFGISIAFLTQLRQLMKPLPVKGKKQISAFNSCLSRVLKQAVVGTYPNYAIDYAAVKLTAGNLYHGCRHFVSADQTKLTFSWCPGMYNCRFEGTAVLLAYNPEKEQWIYHSSNAGSEDRYAELYLPCNFKGDRVETYLYFISADGKRVSDSVYTGSIDIPEAFICGTMVNLN
jgi:hypothetical protein